MINIWRIYGQKLKYRVIFTCAM